MKLNFCVLCGVTDKLEHHHVVPKSLGGSDEEENILTLCSKHHVKIHNLSSNRVHSAELIRAAKTKQKENGIFLGGHVPFGYRLKNNKLIKNTKELEIIEDVRSMRKQGLSLRRLSEWLLTAHNIKKSHVTIAGWIN
jgi:hypothetical protein